MKVIFEYNGKSYNFKELQSKFNFFNKAITITYGDVCENHTGMQRIGKESCRGFSREELIKAQKRFEKLGAECEFHNLIEYLPKDERDNADEAYILIVRKGADFLLKDYNKDSHDFLNEQLKLEWDSTVYSVKHKNNGNGGIVNKNARWNLCYSDYAQKADIGNGKGTVYAFDDDTIKCTRIVRDELPKFLGNLAKNLKAEGNLYYNINNTGIGYHGDGERNLVVAVRLGASISLHYNWFHRNKPVGEHISFILESGDLYVMSEKAVGKDWKKSSILTLRHAAGADKYTKL